MSKTVHFLTSKATKKITVKRTIPEFPMSEKREKIGLKALADFQKGNVRHIKDIDKYLDNL